MINLQRKKLTTINEMPIIIYNNKTLTDIIINIISTDCRNISCYTPHIKSINYSGFYKISYYTDLKESVLYTVLNLIYNSLESNLIELDISREPLLRNLTRYFVNDLDYNYINSQLREIATNELYNYSMSVIYSKLEHIISYILGNIENIEKFTISENAFVVQTQIDEYLNNQSEVAKFLIKEISYPIFREVTNLNLQGLGVFSFNMNMLKFYNTKAIINTYNHFNIGNVDCDAIISIYNSTKDAENKEQVLKMSLYAVSEDEMVRNVYRTIVTRLLSTN